MTRLLLCLLLLTSAQTAKANSVFDQLYRAEAGSVVEATLMLPVDSIMARSEAEQEATLSYLDLNGEAKSWSIKVGSRGKFRRARCHMPPLKFNFSKKDLKAAGLDKFDKYKFVLPCYEGPEADDLVMKEYLAYKAYELLTPASFRTQLVRLKLMDINGAEAHTVLGFLIEETDEMAARNGGEEVEDMVGAPAGLYDPEAEATHALFQYLIGNGDWSLLLRRNVKVIKAGERYLPVGYDFDFTGWVGAPYASANTDIGQTSIYERVYLGYAQADTTLQKVLTRFQQQRRPILNLIRKSSLEEETRLLTERFAIRFFSQINRLRSDEQMTLYDQLRGEIAGVIPAGEPRENYRSTGR